MANNDIYTSRTHFKRVLAGRATPAFTQAPPAVIQVLDPSFFPGMGALNEDDDGRLQCPVRGCGTWHHALGAHLHSAHRGIGGAAAVRVALDIPTYRAFYSPRVKEERRKRVAPPAHLPAHRGAKRSRAGIPTRHSTAARNDNDTCQAQMLERLKAFAVSPTANQFAERFGSNVLAACIHLFGTWNNAKAMAGLTAYRPGNARVVERRLVVESLRAWVGVHGDLPLTTDAQNPTSTPMIPTYEAILKAFDVKSWSAAMRSAIDEIGIRSARYGDVKAGSYARPKTIPETSLHEKGASEAPVNPAVQQSKP